MRRTMTVLLLVVAAASLVLGAAGCGPRVPSGPPAIEGRITSVTPVLGANSAGPADAGMIMIEGSGTIGDKAAITVGPSTLVRRQIKDGSVTDATFADLSAGMRVRAWVDGPVAESYPVQATASAVLVID